jgi:hypothetical protein
MDKCFAPIIGNEMKHRRLASLKLRKRPIEYFPLCLRSNMGIVNRMKRDLLLSDESTIPQR